MTILAGGVGSRFWPVSTPAHPKQVLPLASDRPLVWDALERARGVTGDERIRVLAPTALLPVLRDALPDLPRECFWLEPEARGTAPALAWAAWQIEREEPGAVMVSLHADHVIRPAGALHSLLRGAALLAGRDALLLTVGVEPDRPEVGFGYVQRGDSLSAPGSLSAARVRAFHEKPDPDTAARYVAEGHLWNSGIFIWRVDTFLAELERHAPEVAAHLLRLDTEGAEGFFEHVPVISVDVAVLERSARVGVVTATFVWDDVGSWEALARTRSTDPQGNVSSGEAHFVEAARNVVFTSGEPVVLFGVDDLVVVRTERVTMVASRARAPDLKTLVASLPERLRRLDGEEST